MPKVSVIIPTYNSEEFLRECLDSVVNQTLQDIEIIVVDSISQDNTIPIVEEYISKDPRVKLIKRGKEWVSASRNAALDIATGDYIMFLDSDDWYELNACEVAYNAIIEKGSDILIYGDYIQSADGKIKESWRVHYMRDCQRKKENVDLLKLQMFLWDKIYKRSFLNENNIRMPAEVKQAEDQVFNFTCEFYTDKYSYIDKPLITYRMLRDGASTTDTKGILYDLDAFSYIYNTQIFQEQPLESQLRVLTKFLECQLWNEKKWDTPDLRKQVYEHIKIFVTQVEKMYSKKTLRTLKFYRKLKNLKRDKILKRVFNISNSEDKSHKEISLLGIKIKVRRKNA